MTYQTTRSLVAPSLLSAQYLSLAERAELEVLNQDNAIAYRSIITNTYNDEGLLLSTITESDLGADGLIDNRSTKTNTYNDRGLLLSTVFKATDDFSIEYSITTTNSYDNQGLILSTIRELKHDGVSLSNDERSVISNTYNDEGLLVSTVEEHDENIDGVIDERSVISNTYNDEGLLVSTVEERDWNLDGTIDRRFSKTNTYDDKGLLVSTTDHNGLTTNTYNDRGLLVSSVFDAIGGERFSTINTYDGEGLLVSTVEEFDYDEDDLIDDRSVTINTYDNEGLLLSSLSGNDNDGDGILEDLSETLYEYNDASLTIELYRFRNTSTETGTYLFVEETEKEAILANPDFNQTFALEGVQEDGTINPAFIASRQPEDGLIPFYRLRRLDLSGVYLFVSREEYQAIVAEDSSQEEQWIREGLDAEGHDIAEFYLLPSGAGVGETLDRYANTHNGGFLFVGQAESTAIANNSDLANVFLLEDAAFESFI